MIERSIGRAACRSRARGYGSAQVEEIERAPQDVDSDVKFFAEAKKERHDDLSCFLSIGY